MPGTGYYYKIFTLGHFHYYLKRNQVANECYIICLGMALETFLSFANFDHHLCHFFGIHNPAGGSRDFDVDRGYAFV